MWEYSRELVGKSCGKAARQLCTDDLDVDAFVDLWSARCGVEGNEDEGAPFVLKVRGMDSRPCWSFL